MVRNGPSRAGSATAGAGHASRIAERSSSASPDQFDLNDVAVEMEIELEKEAANKAA
jgi:hypothetical protein